jgi:hypothetical protein
VGVKRTSVTRLGSGEYEDSLQRNSQFHARRRFLHAVFELKPEIRVSLHDEPLKVLRALIKSTEPPPFGWIGWVWKRLNLEPSLEPLRQALLIWRNQWGLTEPWFDECALVELCSYCEKELMPERPAGDPSLRMLKALGYEEPPPFSFSKGRWDPTGERRAVYEAHARQSFDAALKNHLDAAEKEARARGLRRTPEKREAEHFAWLARVYLNGETPAQVWRSLPRGDRRSRRAVEQAIKRLAKFIGTDLSRS